MENQILYPGIRTRNEKGMERNQWADARGGNSDSRLREEKSGFCIQVFVRSTNVAGARGDSRLQTEQEKEADPGVSA